MSQRLLASVLPRPGATPRMSLSIGSQCSRDDVADAIGLDLSKRKGGSWATGYSRQVGGIYIFSNIGNAGRTGHDYPNLWTGKDLIWFSNGSSTPQQPLIREMIGRDTPVHIFWRGRDRARFTYAGPAQAVEVSGEAPVEIRWSFPDVESAMGSEPAHPSSRRGPPPTFGQRSSSLPDGQTDLYLMQLVGPCEAMLPRIGLDDVIGISNATGRRQAELNWGFPPGSSLSWVLTDSVTYPSGAAAYEAEGQELEGLRVSNRLLGGEYALVQTGDLAQLIRSKPPLDR